MKLTKPTLLEPDYTLDLTNVEAAQLRRDLHRAIAYYIPKRANRADRRTLKHLISVYRKLQGRTPAQQSLAA